MHKFEHPWDQYQVITHTSSSCSSLQAEHKASTNSVHFRFTPRETHCFNFLLDCSSPGGFQFTLLSFPLRGPSKGYLWDSIVIIVICRLIDTFENMAFCSYVVDRWPPIKSVLNVFLCTPIPNYHTYEVCEAVYAFQRFACDCESCIQGGVDTHHFRFGRIDF